MQKTNSKYQITYERFYELLKCLLHVINEYLGRLPFAKAEKAALKIADASNTCFESFMHDVGTCQALNNIPPVANVLFFHEAKTAYMQKKLLELRCILVNNKEAMNNVQTPGWLDIMRVIQIYDDIQDAIIDDELQDNLLLSTACHNFPSEWEWFVTHKTSLKQTEKTPLLLSLYMPCSMEYCLQLASDKIKAMNWEQQKIMHYLLFKTKYILYREKMDKNFAVRDKFLLQFYMRTKGRMSHLQEQVIKSNAINICVHIPRERKQLLKKLDFTTAYQLRYNLLSVSAETKAAIFDAVTANQSIC
ncbi:MAG: hypothetical protein ABR503_01335 [Chitinophagaceae bacterium]